MPHIFPSNWRSLQATGAAQRELDTLARLARGLPSTLTVFHGVHWTRIDAAAQAFPAYGEIDFVLLSPAGRVLLIEQRSGFLEESEHGLVIRHAGGEKTVALQLARTVEALRKRLAPLLAGAPLSIDVLLYCPDYHVRQPGTAGLPPERIIDAPRRDTLCERILALMPDEAPRPRLLGQLRRFFADELRLVPDVSSMVGRAEQLVTRLSGGLAHWARRLEFEPFRLRVVGTAGSGKTQLALGVVRDAAGQGRRALYLCYNRPLADHLSRLLGAPATTGAVPPRVLSFHQLCDHALRDAGHVPDYARAGEFDDIAARFSVLEVAPGDQVDELVIDEGQDFQQAWIAPLMRRLAPGGRAWWLEDPMQNLYGRAPVALPGWVTLHADTNFRTPRAVLAEVERICAPPRTTEAAAPLEGEPVEVLAYADTHGLIEATKRAVSDALLARFRREDVAIVTYCGRERSRLLPFDRLGPYRLRSWTGRYDLLGNPEYGEGEVLIETVFRFKGQSAPCVVLTEVDFEHIDASVQRRLFVGMTRASMKLIVVASERAAAIWRARCERDGPGARDVPEER